MNCIAFHVCKVWRYGIGPGHHQIAKKNYSSINCTTKPFTVVNKNAGHMKHKIQRSKKGGTVNVEHCIGTLQTHIL